MLNDTATHVDDRLQDFCWTYQSGDLVAAFLTTQKLVQDEITAVADSKDPQALGYQVGLEMLRSVLPATHVLLMLAQRAVEYAMGERLWTLPYVRPDLAAPCEYGRAEELKLVASTRLEDVQFEQIDDAVWGPLDQDVGPRTSDRIRLTSAAEVVAWARAQSNGQLSGLIALAVYAAQQVQETREKNEIDRAKVAA